MIEMRIGLPTGISAEVESSFEASARNFDGEVASGRFIDLRLRVLSIECSESLQGKTCPSAQFRAEG